MSALEGYKKQEINELYDAMSELTTKLKKAVTDGKIMDIAWLSNQINQDALAVMKILGTT